MPNTSASSAGPFVGLVLIVAMAVASGLRRAGVGLGRTSTFPFIWLPSFLVQVALGSHLLVFRQLRRVNEG